MRTGEIALTEQWVYYQDRAKEAHLGRADHFGLAREEQLWETLRSIESGEPFDAQCRKRLDHIPQNRAKKHLRIRQRLVHKDHSIVFPDSTVDAKDDVNAVETFLSPFERGVERQLAQGNSYAPIAADLQVSEASLKMRVTRWRRQIRDSFPFGT